LLIQQLQDEITRLQRNAAQINGASNTDNNVLHDNTVVELRQQLHKAATHIRQLARDKRILIEVGNRLRAELLRNGNCIASYNCRISPIFKFVFYFGVCRFYFCTSKAV